MYRRPLGPVWTFPHPLSLPPGIQQQEVVGSLESPHRVPDIGEGDLGPRGYALRDAVRFVRSVRGSLSGDNAAYVRAVSVEVIVGVGVRDVLNDLPVGIVPFLAFFGGRRGVGGVLGWGGGVVPANGQSGGGIAQTYPDPSCTHHCRIGLGDIPEVTIISIDPSIADGHDLPRTVQSRVEPRPLSLHPGLDQPLGVGVAPLGPGPYL